MKTYAILSRGLMVGLLAANLGGKPRADTFEFSFTSGFTNAGDIPDGNVNPWSDTRTISGIPAWHTITEVAVRLVINGGYNGDLYGYLSFNGTLVTLLNRPGVGTGNAYGYSDAGLDVTFRDAAAENFHFYQTVPSYSITGGTEWQPDGRAINPISSAAGDFDAAGTLTMAVFRSMTPNGDWTLALADVSAGGGQATVQSWTLAITTVPEPAGGTLLIGGTLLLFLGWRRSGKQRRSSGGRAAQRVRV